MTKVRIFGNYLVEIKQIPDYRDVISELQRAQNKEAITSIITVRPKKPPLDVAKTIELMGILNELLNLAMGKFVFWPKCEGYRQNKLTWQRLQATHLHSFGPRLGFIDFGSNPRALKQFLASSFDNFNKWFSKDPTIARRVLHSYLWGLNLPLLETQIYSLSYTLELLVKKFLNRDAKTYFSRSDRKNLSRELKDFVANRVIKKIIDEGKVDEFKGNKLDGRISDFLRRSFKDQIKALLQQCQSIKYENQWEEWIKEFVKARNDVIHHDHAKSTELFSAWCKGLELIELIFLGNDWLSTEHHQSKIALFQ